MKMNRESFNLRAIGRAAGTRLKARVAVMLLALVSTTMTWAQQSPYLCVDNIRGGDRGIYFKGWAFDNNACLNNVTIEIYHGNTKIYSKATHVYRRDVNQEITNVYNRGLSSYIDNRSVTKGFEFTVPISTAGTYSNIKIKVLDLTGDAPIWSGAYTVTVTAPTFTVSYDANGGINAPASQTKLWNVDLTLSGTEPTRSGYKFNGWNTNSHSTGTNYAPGATYKDNANLALYAKWVAAPVVSSVVFNQVNRNVVLTWTADAIQQVFSGGKWAIYCNGTFVATVDQNTTTFTHQNASDNSADKFPYESNVKYCVYYVMNGMANETQDDGLKSNEMTVNTTRTVPVNGLKAVSLDDRIVFTWSSDGYDAGWGNQFKIYVDNETEPIYTITPTAEQTSFQWEHRREANHVLRQNGVTEGIHWTSESALDVCSPHNYRVEGVIGSTVLNTASVEKKSIGGGTLFNSIDATKGVYPGIVKLAWKVTLGKEGAKTYIVERKPAEKDEAWTELYRTSSADEYLTYTDDTPLAGVYYDYRVTVEDKCDEGTIISNEITDIGFALATGTVSGRITYGSSGSSVEGVEVTIVKAGDSDDDVEQYHAMRFTGTNGAVTWTYPSATYAAGKFAQGDFTLQLWVNPETLGEAKMVRLNGETCYMGMNADGKLTLVNGSDTYPFADAVLTAGQYNHVVLTRSGQTLTASVMGSDAAGVPRLNKSTQTLSGSLSLSGATVFQIGFFKGFVDDFRLWTRCLTDEEIMENYDHQLIGNERGLETYYTFDEGLNTQFFDYSREGTTYHQHHGRMGSNTQSSTLTPAQLKLKAKTDADGNYVIQGIPFAGEGTIYNVTPVLDSHEFSPMKSSRFISTSSLVHNSVDFTDVSSFEVKGTIFFAGTNIPVDSVSIQVDGRAVSRNNEMVVTNAYGEFVIDVPIGHHYISAVKDGHTFVGGGRIPADPTGLNEATMEFKNPLSGLLFYDNTLVTVAGRIVGGAIEADKPIGFGQSKNTIGQAQITLEIPDTRYMLNAYEDNTGLVSGGYKPVADNTPLTTPADASSTGSGYRTGGALEGDAKRVVITTDAATGEFAVLLPPLDYKTVSVQMVNEEARAAYTFPAEQLPRIDASHPATVQKDSIPTTEGGYSYFEYVASLQLTKHTEPVLSVRQKGRNEGVFGDAKAKYSYLDASKGKTVQQEVDLYTVNGTTVTYPFGYPIFSEMGHYTFNLEGYELYTNYEKEASDPDRVTKVPLQNTVVTISNALSADQKVYTAAEVNGTNAGQVADLKDNQLMLDDKGKAVYTWQAGLPNIQSPFTRSLNMTYSNGAGDYRWQGLDAIIFGDLPTGTNFTTKGPSQVDMVLHDPYGDSSFATWETGKVSVTSKDTLITNSSETVFSTNMHLGPALEFSEGIGLEILTELKVIADFSAGFTYTTQDDTTNVHTTTIETSRAVSTSADPDMVGADADIYIGASTNLLFGEARTVGLSGDGTNPPAVGVEDAVTVSQEFETTFYYTQYQIENTVIPGLRKVRNAYLTVVADVDAYTNPGDTTMYVTELTADDENFGEPGTYKRLAKTAGLDMVQYYNEEIGNWQHQIAESEKYKLSLFSNNSSVDKKNISFGGGVEISESVTTEETISQSISHQHSYIVDFSFDLGATINEVGVDFSREQHKTENRKDNGYGVDGVGSNGAEGSSEEVTTTATFSYTLADGGADDSFSMNVYKASGNHGPVFRTLGGQSSCPYQGQEVTKYFEPGKELSAATVQIEKPELACDNPLLTGVPTGGKAQFELLLRNNSDTGADAYFELVPVDGANPKGARLSLPTGDIHDGRTMFVPGGETVKMILTLEQVNLAVTNYEDIQLMLRSSCQNDEGSIHGVIGSTVSLSAHFVPASTPVIMAMDRTVVNTNNIEENLTVRVTGFDRLFAGLQRVDLQYMAPGSQTWSLLKGYIPSEDVRANASQELLPENGVIELPLSMNTSGWTDGTYRFRAQSSALYSGQSVTSESEVLTVVKDLSRPQLFGLASPSDGVLNVDDEIGVTFNEDIQKELLTKNNFVVSGVLNGAHVQHDVALSAQGTERAAYSEASFNLAGKSFSTDMWVRAAESGDIFIHGRGDETFKVSINTAGQLVVTIGTGSYTSVETIPMNTWTFLSLAYSYEEAGSRLSARAVTANDTKDLFVSKAVADYAGIGSITLGTNFTGAIHELTLWDKERTMQEAQAEMYYTKKPSTPGLIGYWKMDEGDGNVIRDYVRNRHLFMPNDTWYLNNDNKSVVLSGTDALKLDITSCNALPTDDYAVEMWFKGAQAAGDGPSTLFSACGGTPAGENPAPVVPSVSMGFDTGGDLTLSARGTVVLHVPSSTVNLLDNAWHHVALNVLRNGSATVYADGTAVNAVAATVVPALEGAFLYVGSSDGTQAFFKGAVDEIRIWNASMTGDLIASQRRARLTGEESGLVAYYSFEEMARDAGTGIITSVASARDLCTGTATAATVGGSAIPYSDNAPAMKVKPEATNVEYSYVANERSIVLTLNELPERLEGTTLTFNVRGMKDMNGNESTPITWTAFVRQNSLLWKGDADVTLEKEVGESASFEATFTNESGNTENWSLSGLPAWLTASTMSGTLKAQQSKTVTFTVAESMAIGKYEQTVYLTGNSNISEPLTLSITVTGNLPDWAVNPHDYETSMNVIGVLKKDDVPLSDPDDILAAFIGDECRGLAHLEYNAIYGNYYVTMDIYGNNNEKGQEVTFRAYDAQTGTIYPEVTMTGESVWTFAPPSLMGSFADPKVFNIQDKIEQVTELKAGWNWISFTVARDVMTVPELFKGIADDVMTVKGHSGYLTYEDNAWAGDLTGDLSPAAMYAVQMKADRKLRVVGTAVTTPVEVKNGWNWIGYYSRRVASLGDALANMTKANDDIVKAQRGVAYWDGSNNAWVGSLLLMEPGKGYQLKSGGSDQSFTYSTFGGSGAQHSPVFRAPEHTQTFKAFAPVSSRNYPDNAIMAVKVVAEGNVLAEVEIGVFADEECRTAAVTDADGVAYLTIPGDENCELTFKVAIGDMVVDAPLTVTYETDAIYGSPRYPMTIDLGDVTAIETVNREPLTTPQLYDLTGRKLESPKLQKGVYIHNGQKKIVK